MLRSATRDSRDGLCLKDEGARSDGEDHPPLPDQAPSAYYAHVVDALPESHFGERRSPRRPESLVPSYGWVLYRPVRDVISVAESLHFARRRGPARARVRHNRTVELLQLAVGPLATNLYLLADPASREAIAIDTAIPSLQFISDSLADRGWTLKLIVSTHGHWDHIGDNAAVAQHTGAQIAAHPLDRPRLEAPNKGLAPFDIPPSVPAVELAEGGVIRFGELRLLVLHTPGHTEGSVSLLAADDGILFSGDTLFANGWGRVDLPGGSPEQMADSIARLSRLGDPLRVLPGHGPATTIQRERAWMDLVVRSGRLFA